MKSSFAILHININSIVLIISIITIVIFGFIDIIIIVTTTITIILIVICFFSEGLVGCGGLWSYTSRFTGARGLQDSQSSKRQ